MSYKIKHTSLLDNLRRREDKSIGVAEFQGKFGVTSDTIRRLGLLTQLEGHNGCVNCLEFNQDGSLLASGSDDLKIILWDPVRHKKKHEILTGHTGNIFSVKFVPHTNNGKIVTAAGDGRIELHETSCTCIRSYSAHMGRIKRLAVSKNYPNIIWSASEDGTIRQFDLRIAETSNGFSSNILVNLIGPLGVHAEAKCLSVNPIRDELFAVGANDSYVRLYDRRMLKSQVVQTVFDSYGEHLNFWSNKKSFECNEEYKNSRRSVVQYYAAGHLVALKDDSFRRRLRPLSATFITFSPDGMELLVNLGGEQIYLFDVFEPRLRPKMSKIISKQSRQIHANGPLNGLPKHVEAIKLKANSDFDEGKFTGAISLYNESIQLYPHSVLYSNRAAAYLKRQWDGDAYAALRDCCHALSLDSNCMKAHLRLVKSYSELGRFIEASEILESFKAKYSEDFKSSKVCQNLEATIKREVQQIKCKQEQNEKVESNDELELQFDAWDYNKMFCGHCNTTTDIKEANFFGGDGQYIVAGSDDGLFFIWDRKSSNIVKILRGDDSIVNCLQSHPSMPLLATSGIDHVVRLWMPRPEDGLENDRSVTDLADTASANQRRMNADPFESFFLTVGHHISQSNQEPGSSPSSETNNVHCRT